MYIPLSFMGGSGTGASCLCKQYTFTALVTGSTVTYTPCNSEVIVAESITSGSSITACVSNWENISYVGNISASINANQEYCVVENCSTCDGYRYYFADAGSGATLYYIPVGATSSVLISKTFTSGERTTLCVAYPQTMYSTTKFDRMSGYLGRCADTSSVCNSSYIPLIGNFVSGGVLTYLTGSSSTSYYGSALISTTQSLAGPALSSSFGRFGYYGTKTNVNNRTYGAGANNTTLLATRTPTTASIAPNVVYGKTINGFNDWYIPSQDEASLAWTGQMWGAPEGVNTRLFDIGGAYRTIAQYFRFTLGTINVTTMDVITSTESSEPGNSPFIEYINIQAGDAPPGVITIGKNLSGSVVPFRTINL